MGVGYFVWLRAVVKPDRLTRSWEAYLILGFIAGLMVSEYIFGASHLVLQGRGFTPWEPVTSVVAMLLSPLPKGVVWGLGAAMFWMHLTIILAFLNFLPLREALPRHHRRSRTCSSSSSGPAAGAAHARPREAEAVRNADGP